MNPPLIRTTPGRRISGAALRAPRLLMSWEDWLTLVAAFIAFVSVAVSIQQAEWVRNMPPIVPTAVAGLVIGLFGARLRFHALVIHPVAAVLGTVVVVLAAQEYADGLALNDRLADFRFRMTEWWNIVWAGDISNDNLPFVTLIEAVAFLYCYLASWSIYRWRNAWLAVLPAGFILLTNISFLKGHPSGAFVTYLFGSLMLVSRLHLQSSQDRWKRDGVEYPEWVSLNTLNFTMIASVLLIVGAWLIPLGTQAAAVEGVVRGVVRPVEDETEHLFRLFHNVDSRKGARLHTFGDTLPIQGEVDLGSKILLEVRSGEGGLIRATSYNEYTGNGWKSTDRDRERVAGGEIAPGEETAGGFEARAVSVLNVRVIDSESAVLTPGIPLGSNLPTYIERPEAAGDIEFMESRVSLDENDAYNSIGSVSRATAGQLRDAGAAYPDWVLERYLQLPSSLPERVVDLARAETEGATNAYDQAAALESYLRTFPFDFSVPSTPAGEDSVDYFLFTLKRGYFDYQATAMAVMLRTLGVPARVAVGYALDPSEAVETLYTVRKDDAYSWVEVYFPTYGWVNFNPTPDRPAGGAGGLGSFVTDDGGEILEPDDLSGLFDDVLVGDGDFGNPLGESPILGSGGGRSIPWPLIYALAALLVVLAAGSLSGRLAWNWGLSGLDGRAAMWEKVQRLSRLAGLGSRPHETPTEWSSRLGSGIGMEDEARRLTLGYEEARYGRPDLQRVDEADVETAYRSLRNRLVNFALRRGKKAGQ